MSCARYIALEGAEGSGKSSQATRLAGDLGGVLTRETGGTRIGVRIREILHNTANTDLAHRAEALLTAADRAQHLQEVIVPALAEGRDVISDRSVYSSLAYQGYGRELDVDELRRINDWAVNGRWPDLVIFLEVADDVLAQRMRGRELDRFEQESGSFHGRVLAGFRAMAAAEPARWAVVDGNGSPDQVATAIRRIVDERYPR